MLCLSGHRDCLTSPPLLLLLLLLLGGASCYTPMQFKYHSLEEINSFMHHLVSEHSSVATLQLLGKTNKGRSIWHLILSARAKQDGFIPNLHIIANIYGNDLVTREMALHLVEYMVHNQESDPDVHWLLNNVRIHVVPSVNVDGSDASIPGDCSGMTGGENSNGVGINRNFPGAFDRSPPASRPALEPESAAVLRLERAYPATLSVLLFAGLFGVLYPYDDVPGSDMPWLKTGSRAPDADVFEFLAKFMVTAMGAGAQSPCDGKPAVGAKGEGFVNGASYYPISGSLADYTYAYEGSLPLSVYVGCCKYDDQSKLKGLFERTRGPLLKLLRQANKGQR
ncbi:carboxypeptidase M-like isoform X2 [Haemaphysalis longicornis]